MTPSSSSVSRPLPLAAAAEGQTYLLFALALALTIVGVYFGISYQAQLLSSGLSLIFVILELAIILTSSWWVRQSPLNIVLFGLFPLLSGLTLTPYILSVLAGYVNGGAILGNALLATASMTAAAGVLALFSGWNLSGLGRMLFFSVLGLIALSIVQVFVPAMRTGVTELWLSAGGIVIFSLFTAYDIQRISTQAKLGASPFLLALSLYLDIFNLFLYILRFMVAFSGDRR